MGFLDALLGRTKPAAPDLDRLFGLSGAAVTLQVTEGLVTTLQAAVCFKPAAGQAFGQAEQELLGLLQLDGGGETAVRVERDDQYGYRWVVVTGPDLDTLVTRVHFVNSTLAEHGYGPQLLCSVFGFGPAPGGTSTDSAATASTSAGGSAYLVYLYKRGSFYPFVPLTEKRDNEAELRLKELLGDDLTVERDLNRWFPLWGLPLR